MRILTCHTGTARMCLSVVLCMAGILQPSAQNEKETELQLNKDAVKMILFDFSGNPSEQESPRQAPIEKKWMNFKEDLRMPRNMTDTARLWKPGDYFRFEPYTIWTRFGEDPIYDKLVMGRPKKLEFSWELNPNATHYDKDYGRSITPSTGRMNRSATGSAGVGATIGGLDFIGFIYHNFTRHGRMLAYNRKHSDVWKNYKDYKPTKEDSMKVPNFYRRLSLPVHVSNDTDSVTPPPMQADTVVQMKGTETNEPSSVENEDNLYELIRLKQREDSIRSREKPRKDNANTNPYDIQRQIWRLREMSN